MQGVRLVLYRLPDLQGETLVYVVEGEKDVQALADLDLVATTSPGGAGKWRDDYAARLVATGTKTVVLLPGPRPGRRGARADRCPELRRGGADGEGRAAPRRAAEGRRVGLDRRRRLMRDALLALVEATAELTVDTPGARQGEDRPGHPRTTSTSAWADLKEAARALWAIIESHNTPPTLFRTATLAWVERDDDGAPFVRPLTPPRVTHWLAQHIYFHKVVATKLGPIEVPTNPPATLVHDMLATPEPPLPVLTRIVQTPIVAADGTLHETAGYDPRTRAWYAPAPNFAMSPVPLIPTTDDLVQARESVLEIFRDFPLVGAADLAAVVAALLSLFVRDLVDGPVPHSRSSRNRAPGRAPACARAPSCWWPRGTCRPG